MSEDSGEGRNFSRRTLGKGLLAAALGGSLPFLTRSRYTPPSHTVPGSVLVPIPPLDREAALAQTEVAVQTDGRRDTFVPEGNFTREVFQFVQNATFRIAPVTGSADEGTYGGTGWCAKVDDRDLYIVTAAHVLTNLDDDVSSQNVETRVKIWRPFIDSTSIEVTSVARVDEKHDIAVFRCNVGNYNEPEQFTQLQVEEESPFTIGDKFMVVGFPKGLNNATAGQVVTSEGYDVLSDRWRTHTILAARASGSPAVSVSPDGKVVCKGICVEEVIDKNIIIFEPLHGVNRMITELKQEASTKPQ